MLFSACAGWFELFQGTAMQSVGSCFRVIRVLFPRFKLNRRVDAV